MFDELTSGLATPDSTHNEQVKVTGQIAFIASLAREELRRKVESGTPVALEFNGVNGLATWQCYLGNCRLKGMPKGKLDRNKPTEVTVDFEAYVGATDTQMFRVSTGVA
jgi:hypothetical protein